MQKPLVGLNRTNIVRELTAGVTLLAIAIPLNIGYAQIAGRTGPGAVPARPTKRRWPSACS